MKVLKKLSVFMIALAVIDNLFGYTPKTYYWNSPTTKGRTFSIGLSIEIKKG